jgi:diguanylate cyclase (GGDEF)-like protein
VTASFGIAVFPLHGYLVEDLLRIADSALYRAKAKGRDRLEVASLFQQ